VLDRVAETIRDCRRYDRLAIYAATETAAMEAVLSRLTREVNARTPSGCRWKSASPSGS
jgi:hypothetical protein